jgi:aspartyl-tRNA(Asn)/glutamyl-tRNA(Gln) amidotransferase subunit B
VTAPDFDCADDVVTFAQELRNLCMFLGVTEGIMQRGHMRFEPNINLVIDTADGREVRTPVVEIKNLNSFRALRGAIEHEAKRQAEAWQADGKVMGPGAKTTRGWDDERLVTLLQREKEDAHDYRYFPEPDLVGVEIDEAWLAAIRGELPELPMARRARYAESFGLPEKDAAVLVGDRDLCRFFEACHAAGASAGLPDREAGHGAAKLLLNAGAKRANEAGRGIHELGIAAARVAELVRLRHEGAIDAQAADLLFGRLCEQDGDAASLAAELGLVKVRDEAAMDRWVEEAIAANPAAAEDLRSGKQAAIGRLVGHAMKASGGSADAKEVRERILRRLA